MSKNEDHGARLTGQHDACWLIIANATLVHDCNVLGSIGESKSKNASGITKGGVVSYVDSGMYDMRTNICRQEDFIFKAVRKY